MALSESSVTKGWYILNDINPKACNSFVQSFEKGDKEQENKIFGYDQKSDGGWESLFTYIKGMTHEQKLLWEKRKHEIPNSSITRELEDDLTKIGWF